MIKASYLKRQVNFKIQLSYVFKRQYLIGFFRGVIELEIFFELLYFKIALLCSKCQEAGIGTITKLHLYQGTREDELKRLRKSNSRNFYLHKITKAHHPTTEYAQWHRQGGHTCWLIQMVQHDNENQQDQKLPLTQTGQGTHPQLCI